MALEIPPTTAARVLRIDKADLLKHFSKDPPWVKLIALLLCRLPYILTACGGLVFWGWRLH